MLASWASTSEPAKTPVTALSWSIVTLTTNVGSVASATSRISRKIGFPLTLHQVDPGSPTIGPLWFDITASAPAMPGSTALPPPEYPAKMCGSTSPVRIFTLACM